MGFLAVNVFIILQIFVFNDSNFNEAVELSGRLWHPSAEPYPWKEFVEIYYEVDPNFPQYHLNAIEAAVDYFNSIAPACKQWVKYDAGDDIGDNDWRVVFTYVEDTSDAPNCSSTFRHRDGNPRQYLVLGKYCLLIDSYEEVIQKAFENPNFHLPENVDIPEYLHLDANQPERPYHHIRNLGDSTTTDREYSLYVIESYNPWHTLTKGSRNLRWQLTAFVNDTREQPKCTRTIIYRKGYKDIWAERHYRIGRWCWLWARFQMAKSTVLHHMMRTMGFRLEHTRPDRDCFVTIHPDMKKRLPPNLQTFYKKVDYVHNEYVDHQIPYDYFSITHYNNYINPKNNSIKRPLGRYFGDLSEYDIYRIKQMYCRVGDYCSQKEGSDWKPECTAMWNHKNLTSCHWW